MAKFKIKVTVTAQCEYEVEVDTDTEAHAENTATGLWREKLPEDFQVEKGYITDWEAETEQLTAICPDCDVEHTIPTNDRSLAECDCWWDDKDYCAACGAKIEAAEKGELYRDLYRLVP